MIIEPLKNTPANRVLSYIPSQHHPSFCSRIRTTIKKKPTTSRGTSLNNTNANDNSIKHSFDDYNLFIIGLGRVGKEVAQQANDRNVFASISGTTRTDRSSERRVHATPSDEVIGSISDDSNDSNDTNDTDRLPCTLIEFDNTTSVRNAIANCTHLLVSIPPNQDPAINDSLNQLYDTILSFAMQPQQMNTTNRTSSLLWIGIISTTGVYGNHNGTWVTEESELIVTSTSFTNNTSSQYRYIQYEREWKNRIDRCIQQQQQQQGASVSLNVFRSAGIYSDDQSALHTVYNKQLQVGVWPSSSFISSSTTTTSTGTKNTDITNRIHVFDLASMIVASMILPMMMINKNDDTDVIRTQNGQRINSSTVASSQPSSSSSSSLSSSSTSNSILNIYNCADDLPESRTVVMDYALQLLRHYNVTIQHISRLSSSSSPSSPNPINNTTPSASSNVRDRRRSTDSKRISNDKIKRLLRHVNGHDQLRFPTYQQGLHHVMLTSFTKKVS